VRVDPVTALKLSIVLAVVVGGIVLVGLGRIDAHDFFGDLATVVTGLLVALGLTGAASQVAQGQRDAARLSIRPPPPERDRS
jgi:hypothetical protein